jgi:energy-coupling factor transport system permease protein
MQTFYYEADSLLHRLNPLSKALALMPALIFVALTTDPWTPVVFIGFIALMLLTIGKVPITNLARIAGPILLMMISFGLIYPFAARADLVSNSPMLFHLGPLTVYQAGVINGLIVILRTCALLSLSLLFTLTTDTSDFIRAMVQQWKLPYKLGYGALAAFRFLPMLQAEMQLIQAAHKVRGIADQGGIRVHYDRLRRYAIPLLATAIRRAERTALAMDGRAFGVFPTRSYYKQFRFTISDYLFIASFWLLNILIIVTLWRIGLLGPLSLLQKV